MAEPARHPPRIGPLAELARQRGAVIATLRPSARFVLRGGAAAIERAGEALGLALPQAACRSGSSRTLATLWLGPDEWLLVADDDGFAAPLAAALAGLAHALVDVSHRTASIEVSGPGAAELINAGCPLDLGPDAFPPGACTRTVFGKAEIVLWRTGERRYRIEVARSFAEYAWLLLQQAASMG